VKAAIENLFRQKFNCDIITVQSADEYHCNQHDKVIFLKAKVSTLFAKDRVDRFYYYLDTEKLSLFGGTVEVKRAPDDDTPGQSADPMIYLYAFIAVVLLCVVIIFIIIATVLVIKKKSFK
jgi:hypothetical protein